MRSRYSSSRDSVGNSAVFSPYILLNEKHTSSRAASSLQLRKSLRRTTSKPSLAPTGFQIDSMRPKVCSICSSARWPASPPISLSDSGMEATTRLHFEARAASVSSWMKVMKLSSVPAGNLSAP